MRVLNFGSLNLDYVYAVDHFVRPGETLSAASRAVKCGGKGLNQSIALARAGAEVCHAGCLGAGGEPLRQLLAEDALAAVRGLRQMGISRAEAMALLAQAWDEADAEAAQREETV